MLYSENFRDKLMIKRLKVHVKPRESYTYGFLMFSGGRERVHWERMG